MYPSFSAFAYLGTSFSKSHCDQKAWQISNLRVQDERYWHFLPNDSSWLTLGQGVWSVQCYAKEVSFLIFFPKITFCDLKNALIWRRLDSKALNQLQIVTIIPNFHINIQILSLFSFSSVGQHSKRVICPNSLAGSSPGSTSFSS